LCFHRRIRSPHGRHGENEQRPRHPGHWVLYPAYDAARSRLTSFPLSVSKAGVWTSMG
jgi:hypothetical protein